MSEEDYFLSRNLKVVYQTNPIGPDKIVLYLTTFDTDMYHYGKVLDPIPIKEEKHIIELPNNRGEHYLLLFEKELKEIVNETYEKQLLEMRKIIDSLRNMRTLVYTDFKDISNSDDVHCNIVEGNITNCDNVYCNEIKGNVVNCDKIVYKNKE